MTSISRRARWAPRQKCGPAAPKPKWGLGRAAYVEGVGILEGRLVPVGRVVEEQDLVALGGAPRPESTVSSVTVRRIQITGEAHRTISSTPVAAMVVGIGLPQRPLVGVLGEGQQARG